MRLLLLLLRASRLAIALAVLAGLLSGASSAGLLSLTSAALVGSSQGRGWHFAVMCALALLSRFASHAVLNWMHHRLLLQLRMQLSRRILVTPLRRIEELGSHRLLAALTNDVLTLSNGLMLLPQLVIHFAILLGCLGYMAWLSWPLFLATLGLMGVGLLSYLFPASRSLRLMYASRDAYDTLLRHFRSLMEGLKELKVHRPRQQAFLREELDATSMLLRRLEMTSSNIDAANSSWGMLLFFAIIGMLLFVVPSFWPVDAATLTGYCLTILYMQQPLDVVLNSFHTVASGAVSLGKLEALDLESAPPEPQAPLQAPAAFERLELLEVTHTYQREQEDGRFILGPISLTLRPGELVFLVGGNGSGKTTLAKLLVGLYTPESGEVRLDGVPIVGEQGWERYRQLFSVVFSDFCLFERLHGLQSPALEQQGQHYLELLQLSHKVRLEDGALSTTALSQGQRKRLALLTAYLEDRPFYVFDEWAADQDPHFRAIFYEQLLVDLKRRGKAVLVISHDDRYFHLADRLLRLEYGQLTPQPQAPEGPPLLRSHGT